MKGVLLAGGVGSRLYPITTCVAKQFVPVYDKPAIFYPLAMLMLAGIRDIMVVPDETNEHILKRLLGDGSQYGLNFDYAISREKKGICYGYGLAEKFVDGDNSCLIFCDNLFYAPDIQSVMMRAADNFKGGGNIFAIRVPNPSDYGVVEFDADMNVLSLEEKPANPKTNWAVPGLYFYDDQAFDLIRTIKPSARGELEVTDLNNIYLSRGQLKLTQFSPDTAWVDIGSHDTLLNASNFVHTLWKNQGVYMACLEEIALKKGFIDVTHYKAMHDKAKPNKVLYHYMEQVLEDFLAAKSGKPKKE